MGFFNSINKLVYGPILFLTIEERNVSSLLTKQKTRAKSLNTFSCPHLEFFFYLV